MKKIALFIFCLFSTPALAQVPSGAVEIYDMVTITGGTTLVDQSGNGNNGTLNGTTPGSTGITFNGSSDYISIPSVIGNSDFTAFVCLTNPTQNSGRIWSENSTATGQPNAQFTTLNGFFNTGSNGYQTTFGNPTFYKDWHCVYELRRGARVTFGNPDQNLVQTLNVGNVTVSMGTATIGAQRYTGTTNAYFAGTIAYAYVYTRALSQSEITNLYNATRTILVARNVFMRDIVSSLFPSRIWNRMGVIIPTQGSNPTLGHTTTDCILISNPCFQLWYDVPGANHMNYAESPNALPPWTIQSTILSSYDQGQVTRVTGFSYKYLMLATPIPSTRNKDALTSNDPIHFTLAKANALVGGASGAFDHSIFNSTVFQLGSILYAAYEGAGDSGGASFCGGATSTDGLNWTKVAANPITGYGDFGCQGPFLWLNPTTNMWYMWQGSPFTTSPPGGMYRRQSTVFNQVWNVTAPGAVWVVSSGLAAFPTLPADAPDEYNFTNPSLVEVNGVTYLAADASDASGAFYIKLYIANMPLASLVLTGEGEISPQP